MNAKLKTFLFAQDAPPATGRAASLFSGAGLSDIGYVRAGYAFTAHAELEAHRSALGAANITGSKWVTGDIRHHKDEFLDAVGRKRLDLLTATPPCQGLSSSNPTRGRRRTPDEAKNRSRNMLLLEVIPCVKSLTPRVFVAENVRQVLTLAIDGEASVVSALAAELPDYKVFHTVINVADYGIPQARLRAVIVGVHRDEPWLAALEAAGASPWPRRTHSADKAVGHGWINVGCWFDLMKYPPLDAGSVTAAIGEHPLHRVPVYDSDRYFQVASIPPDSGRSAYENDCCPSCGFLPVPVGRAYCTRCRRAMRNRPYVARGGFRLIRGFHSSYRRMRPDQPAPPVMTSSGRVGSDYKIHPWEHRVLSILECADLQTVPRTYDWSYAIDTNRYGLIREVVGEALPPYFTFLHGQLLLRLIGGDGDAVADCELTGKRSRSALVKRATVSRALALTGRGYTEKKTTRR